MQTQINGKAKKNNGAVLARKNGKTDKKSAKDADITLNHEHTQNLQKFLADTFVLYMKTYAVHWNYKGPKFFSVHKMTEEQYGLLEVAIDELAERIRAKRDAAPFTLAEMLKNADLDELKTDGGMSDLSVKDLADSHELLSKEAIRMIKEIEDEDPYTADMLTARIGAHDKANWMLRSLLAK